MVDMANFKNYDKVSFGKSTITNGLKVNSDYISNSNSASSKNYSATSKLSNDDIEFFSFNSASSSAIENLKNDALSNQKNTSNYYSNINIKEETYNKIVEFDNNKKLQQIKEQVSALPKTGLWNNNDETQSFYDSLPSSKVLETLKQDSLLTTTKNVDLSKYDFGSDMFQKYIDIKSDEYDAQKKAYKSILDGYKDILNKSGFSIGDDESLQKAFIDIASNTNSGMDDFVPFVDDFFQALMDNNINPCDFLGLSATEIQNKSKDELASLIRQKLVEIAPDVIQLEAACLQLDKMKSELWFKSIVECKDFKEYDPDAVPSDIDFDNLGDSDTIRQIAEYVKNGQLSVDLVEKWYKEANLPAVPRLIYDSVNQGQVNQLNKLRKLSEDSNFPEYKEYYKIAKFLEYKCINDYDSIEDFVLDNDLYDNEFSVSYNFLFKTMDDYINKAEGYKEYLEFYESLDKNSFSDSELNTIKEELTKYADMFGGYIDANNLKTALNIDLGSNNTGLQSLVNQLEREANVYDKFTVDKLMEYVESYEWIDTADLTNWIDTTWEGGVDGLIGYVDGLESWILNDSYSAHDYKAMYISSLLQQSKGLEFNYNLSSSIGNMAPSIVLGTLNPALGKLSFFASAGGASVKHAKMDYDVSDGKALMFGVLSGLSEVALEKYLGAIPGLSDVEVTSFKTWIKAALKEGNEEFVQGYVDDAMTYHILNDKNAANEINMETFKGHLYEFAMGAASGGILNSGSAIIGQVNIKNNINLTSVNASSTTNTSINTNTNQNNKSIGLNGDNQNAIKDSKDNNWLKTNQPSIQTATTSGGVFASAGLTAVGLGNANINTNNDVISVSGNNNIKIEMPSSNTKTENVQTSNSISIPKNKILGSNDFFDKLNTGLIENGKFYTYGVDQDACNSLSLTKRINNDWLGSEAKFEQFLRDKYKIDESMPKVKESLLTKDVLSSFSKKAITSYIQNNTNSYEEAFETFSKSFEQVQSPFYNDTINLLTSRGINEKDAISFAQSINNNGIGTCSYASICNNIINAFSNNESEFKNAFGYDMYINIDGKQVINSPTLLADLFIFANTDVNGGGNLLLQDESGGLSINNKETDQFYMSDSLTTYYEMADRFLKSKNVALTIDGTTDSFYDKSSYSALAGLETNSANLTVDKIKSIITNHLDNGRNLNIEFLPPKDGSKIYRYLNSDNANDVYITTNSWSEDGGHSTFVTGLTDASVIVSSWGRKLYVPFEDFIGNKFNLSYSTIQGIDNLSIKNDYQVVDTSSLNMEISLFDKYDINTNESYKGFDYVIKTTSNVSSIIDNVLSNYDGKSILIEIDNINKIDLKTVENLPSNVSVRIGNYDLDWFKGFSKSPHASANAILGHWTYSVDELKSILSKIQVIEEGIDPNWSKYEIAQYVYEYMKNNIKYNANPGGMHIRAKNMDGLTSLIVGESTCQGFASTYKTLLNGFGIDAVDVLGSLNGEGQHAYNIVTIDGKSFIVDTVREMLEKNTPGMFPGTGFGVENVSQYQAKNNKDLFNEVLLSSTPNFDNTSVGVHKEMINNANISSQVTFTNDDISKLIGFATIADDTTPFDFNTLSNVLNEKLTGLVGIHNINQIISEINVVPGSEWRNILRQNGLAPNVKGFCDHNSNLYVPDFANLHTVVHESLHKVSELSKTKINFNGKDYKTTGIREFFTNGLNSDFANEGLTEYLASKLTDNKLYSSMYGKEIVQFWQKIDQLLDLHYGENNHLLSSYLFNNTDFLRSFVDSYTSPGTYNNLVTMANNQNTNLDYINSTMEVLENNIISAMTNINFIDKIKLSFGKNIDVSKYNSQSFSKLISKEHDPFTTTPKLSDIMNNNQQYNLNTNDISALMYNNQYYDTKSVVSNNLYSTFDGVYGRDNIEKVLNEINILSENEWYNQLKYNNLSRDTLKFVDSFGNYFFKDDDNLNLIYSLALRKLSTVGKEGANEGITQYYSNGYNSREASKFLAEYLAHKIFNVDYYNSVQSNTSTTHYFYELWARIDTQLELVYPNEIFLLNAFLDNDVDTLRNFIDSNSYQGAYDNLVLSMGLPQYDQSILDDIVFKVEQNVAATLNKKDNIGIFDRVKSIFSKKNNQQSLFRNTDELLSKFTDPLNNYELLDKLHRSLSEVEKNKYNTGEKVSTYDVITHLGNNKSKRLPSVSTCTTYFKELFKQKNILYLQKNGFTPVLNIKDLFDDQTNAFLHVNSRDFDMNDIGHRLYANVDFDTLYKILPNFMDRCEKLGLDYYFKTACYNGNIYNEYQFTRDETIVIYSNKENLYKYYEIFYSCLNEIKDVEFGALPQLTASIDGIIGYGAEPRESGRESFNSLRSKVIDRAFYLLNDWEQKNYTPSYTREEQLNNFYYFLKDSSNAFRISEKNFAMNKE